MFHFLIEIFVKFTIEFEVFSDWGERGIGRDVEFFERPGKVFFQGNKMDVKMDSKS